MELNQIKAESVAKGSNFFTPETKKAYKTRFSKRTAAGPGGVYFVTSEEIQTVVGVPERRFAVRSYNVETGEVTLVTALGQFATDYAAHTHAKSLASPTPVGPVVVAAAPVLTLVPAPVEAAFGGSAAGKDLAQLEAEAVAAEPAPAPALPVAAVLGALVACAGGEAITDALDAVLGSNVIPFPTASNG